jgi:hypothetical protein
MGVYGTTLCGKPLPPLYILSMASLQEDDYRVDPCICKGLPIVAASYGSKAVQIHSSSICMRHKGSMDAGLWHQLVWDLYIPLYEGCILPEPICNSVMMKLILGPLIVKTDSGPGRLSKEVDSIQFCKQMAGLDTNILLSFPNATACTAKMDQLFEKLKPACSMSPLCVALCKMQQRMMVRVENANQVVSLLDGLDDNNRVDPVIDPVVDDGPGKHHEQSICNISFSNMGLGNLVIGWPDDPVELRLFDCHFNAKQINKTWIAVGFMPMMENAANDAKVRYKLGEWGAPPEASDQLIALHAEYRRAGDALTSIGLNGAMFDI